MATIAFLRAGRTLTLIGFAAIVFLTMQLKCWGGGIGFPGAKVTGA